MRIRAEKFPGKGSIVSHIQETKYEIGKNAGGAGLIQNTDSQLEVIITTILETYGHVWRHF